MRRRQTAPREWLIVADAASSASVRRVGRRGGVLLLTALPAAEVRRLRLLARQRGLTLILGERRSAARVHNLPELRAALLARTALILLSPIYPTASHPEWAPIPRMRGAAMARLGGRRLIALGGMDARRFARISGLGFQGWAGISAFRT